MLVLFDIDGTLLTGDGIGMRALVAASRRVFGQEFRADGVAYAGRLDPLILDELLAANGVSATAENLELLKRAYYSSLSEALGECAITPLPGAAELVAHLCGVPWVTVGLLTGNFPESGRRKLLGAGFDLSAFRVCVWGDDSPHSPPHRDHLAGVAMARYAALHSAAIDPSGVVVIGDTPGDVRCAHHVGARCLGVTTGRFDSQSLTDAGADLVVDSLENTADLAAWILTPLRASTGTER